MQDKFDLKLKRIDRKYKRKQKKTDRKFARRAARRQNKFERKMAASDRRIERNQARYERRLALINKRYIRQRPKKLLTAIGVLFSIAVALFQWVAFAFIDSSSLIETASWLQSIINGIIVIPSIVTFSLALIIAFLISKIPIDLVQSLVSKISTIIFSILMLGYVEATPELFSALSSFNLDYITLFAPIIVLTSGCYFMSYNSIRKFYSSLTDRAQSNNILGFKKMLETSKVETSTNKLKFLSLSLDGLDGVANTKTIGTIVVASIIASLAQILCISNGAMSMPITCFILFALPSVMDILEIFARPKESARESLFGVAKDVFSFTAKQIF